MLCVHIACLFWIEHVEDAFEIVNLFSGVHLKDLVLLVVGLWFVSVIIVTLNVAASQLFFYLLLSPLLIVLVNAVIFLFLLPLCVIVTFLVVLLVHFKLNSLKSE